MKPTYRLAYAALAGAFLVITMAVTGSTRAQSDEGAFVWLEGEAPRTSTFNQHGWYSREGVHLNWLSPGRPDRPEPGGWLAHYSDSGQEAEAEYDFDAPRAGHYTFWIRSSSYKVRQWYRLDDGPQTAMDLESDPREYLNLTHPALDLRFLAWHRVGSLDLAAGAHRLRVGLSAHPFWGGNKVHGGIDAMALTNFRWFPAGATQPTLAATPEPAPDAWFPLVAEDDPFDEAAITDVSRFVPAPAGARGPLQRRGDSLAFADGTPVRFWGIGADMAATPELQDQQARLYAKYGVNLVRLHPVEDVVGLLQVDPATGGRRLDPGRLDVLDRWFATLKARGIYMAWSPFYPHVITPADGYPPELYAELPDSGAGKSTSGLVALEPQLAAAEWAWLEALLDHVNPYTGMRYADDPALAILEVHNEDSVFWHYPLNDLAAGQAFPRHTARLKAAWARWLRGRYASDEDLLASWGPPGAGSRGGDSLANEAMAIYGAWEMEADGPRLNKAEGARMGDFIRFLAETQRSYYEERGRQVRRAGFRGVLVTTAWRAGGPAAGAANTWTDDALDMIDRHGYFGGGAGRHRIVPGDVANGTHLARPGTGILSAGFDQIEDKPFLMSEWNQSPPNQWRGEIAPLMAFYGLGLQGWDGLIHFHGRSAHMAGGWPRLSSYVTETPLYLGQFPALAMAVHRGDIARGDIAAARRLATEDLFRGVDPLTQRLPGLGFTGDPPADTLTTPPEVLAIGRITQKAAAAPATSRRLDWSRYWRPGDATVESTTGELTWDYGRRVVTVTAARTQAVVGFAGGDTYDLPAFRVEVSTPFVSLLFTALDDRPLMQTTHVLITALARDRQTGATYSADGTRLLDVGAPPLLLEPVQARITFKGPPITYAGAVDTHGRPTGRRLELSGNTFTIDGRYATYYYEVRTAPATATPTRGAVGTSTPGATPSAPAPGPTTVPVSRGWLPACQVP